jgi:hypothetical protein
LALIIIETLYLFNKLMLRKRELFYRNSFMTLRCDTFLGHGPEEIAAKENDDEIDLDASACHAAGNGLRQHDECG